jgi:AraC-like DNA-binding protein
MTPYIVSDIKHYCNVSVAGCSRIHPHTINYYDLTFVTKGTMTYFANGEKCEMCENDTILLPPGTQRERLEGNQRVEYVSFNFYILPDFELKTPFLMKNVITRDIRKLVDVFPQKRLSTLYRSKEKLTNLLNYILFEILESFFLESNNPDIIQIKKFIEENICSKITLKMISDHVHLSEEYISFLFKKHTGKTVIEYVNGRKMALAKQMLESREMSLKNISESLGFENYGYFSRVFKKHFSAPPARLKKEYGKMPF